MQMCLLTEEEDHCHINANMDQMNVGETNIKYEYTIQLVNYFKIPTQFILKECVGQFHPDKQLDLVNCMFASQNWRNPKQSAQEVRIINLLLLI